MNFTPTRIKEVVLVEPDVFGDERGFFMESYRYDVFSDNGIELAFVQDNHSRSRRGVLRGLHYKICQPQGKLVRVIDGEVFDVAVDLRKNSPTFGQWVGENLSSENKRMLWVPPGFAHGFYVVSEIAEITYKCTDYYAPEHERSICWDDSDLSIRWPLISSADVLVSARDCAATGFRHAECYL